jgi:hypothetical protein
MERYLNGCGYGTMCLQLRGSSWNLLSSIERLRILPEIGMDASSPLVLYLSKSLHPEPTTSTGYAGVTAEKKRQFPSGSFQPEILNPADVYSANIMTNAAESQRTVEAGHTYTMLGGLCLSDARIHVVESMDYMEAAALPFVNDGKRLRTFLPTWASGRPRNTLLIAEITAEITNHLTANGRCRLNSSGTCGQIALLQPLGEPNLSSPLSKMRGIITARSIGLIVGGMLSALYCSRHRIMDRLHHTITAIVFGKNRIVSWRE